MNVDVVRYEDEALVRLTGSLDVQTARQVRERLWRLLIEGVTEIVVDVADLTFMDRVGLDVLDAVSHLLAKGKGRFVVCSPSEEVRALLRQAFTASTIIR